MYIIFFLYIYKFIKFFRSYVKAEENSVDFYNKNKYNSLLHSIKGGYESLI